MSRPREMRGPRLRFALIAAVVAVTALFAGASAQAAHLGASGPAHGCVRLEGAGSGRAVAQASLPPKGSHHVRSVLACGPADVATVAGPLTSALADEPEIVAPPGTALAARGRSPPR